MDNQTLTLQMTSVAPGANFSASAHFFQGTSTDIPTGVRYRVDGVSYPGVVRNWTPLVPGFSSVSVVLDENDNQMIWPPDPREILKITLESTKGSTVLTSTATWTVVKPTRPVNLGYPVTSRDFSWLEMVNRQWGSEYRAPDHRIYEFSNGRGFDSTDIGQTGIYRRR